MGFLTSLSMLILLTWLFWLPSPAAPSLSAARALDALLQDSAYRSFVRPRTGVVYDGQVPSNLTGIKVSGLRLRSGSLRTRGVPTYKEFQLPMGVVEEPYVERLVFVYHNLGNWSSLYYPLPSGYVFLAPVLGLLAYDASNLSATDLPELDIKATAQPISIRFSEVMTRPAVPDGSVPKCVSFDLQGLLNFTAMLAENTCATFREGHFSIVVESIGPSPAPAPPPAPPPRGKGGGGRKKNHHHKKEVWIIVGSVLGGLALLVLLGLLVVWMLKFKTRKKMQQMEKAAEVGEALHMTRVGSTKAPSATVTRTQPTLETEYVP
ncbi:unnamed protein product [Coffea canephora]|uniref:Malectin-like domain-containing protein n=1 Tax=Coffea canephora TaxID=49390 RepID=A0A068UFG2_COFCA|nr:unnamed protein product [Coffea canephora]